MDERSERLEQRLEPLVILATLLVVPVLLLQRAGAGAPWNTIATVGDWVTWLVFLAEIVIMLAVVPNRGRWLAKHPLDVAIVVFTPPFLTAALTSMRLLRLARLIRLLRVAQMARGAFSLAGVRYAGLLAILTAFAGAQAFATAENIPDSDAFYWALSTMTTVGYGDVAPHTGTGQVIAVTVMIVGIGFAAVLTGAIAQRFVKDDEERGESDVRELHAKADELRAQLARIEATLTQSSDHNGGTHS